MKKLFFVLCIFHFTAQGQDLQNQKLKVFFSCVIDSIIIKEVNQNSIVIISSQTSTIAKLNDDWFKSFSSIISLKLTDVDSLIEKANMASSLVLTSDNIQKSKFILSSDFTQSLSGKETFCTFSNPVFFQDNNYCLFAYDIAKSGGETLVFKKERSKWKVYKRICAWYY